MNNNENQNNNTDKEESVFTPIQMDVSTYSDHSSEIETPENSKNK